MYPVGSPQGYAAIAGKDSRLDLLDNGGQKRYVSYLGFFGKGLLAADGQVPMKQPYQFHANGACNTTVLRENCDSTTR